ncbi:MFS transporter [Kistimonas scapharcae]|uniref:MFS transporter n=1 Tax=Kistimonas scapharcae TaxID=1036133 RepID=A0ABP8V7I3_9GAMM
MLNKLILVTCLGAMLEYFDFTLVLLFANDLAKLFLPEADQSGFLWIIAIHTAGYFIRPLGGIAFSHFGDRIGRKRLFRISILIMTFATLSMGLLPTYATIGYLATVLLIILRSLQGISVGGEFPGAVVFAAEHVPHHLKGLITSAIGACGLLGVMLASTIGMLTHSLLSEDELYNWGWRLPFIAGSILGVSGYIMRRSLSETPLFSRLIAAKQVVSIPLLTLFQTQGKTLAIAMGMNIASVTMLSMYTFMVPYATRHLGMHQSNVYEIMTATLLMTAMLTLVFGWLSDRGINRRLALLISNILYLLVAWPVFLLLSDHQLFTVGLLTLLPTALACGNGLVTLANLFNTNVRYTGLAVSMNISICLIAGSTPYILEILSVDGKPFGFLVMMLVSAVIGIIATWHLPETRVNDYQLRKQTT